MEKERTKGIKERCKYALMNNPLIQLRNKSFMANYNSLVKSQKMKLHSLMKSFIIRKRIKRVINKPNEKQIRRRSLISDLDYIKFHKVNILLI